MRWTRQRRLLAGLLVLAVASSACNPITTLYFIGAWDEPKDEAEFPLVKKDHRRKEVKVVVLTSNPASSSVEFLNIDWSLASLFTKELQKKCTENQEKVSVVPVHTVEKYKADHPDWKTTPAEDIGKFFEADYVIDLEIMQMSLYEKDSHRTLYRGHADISVSVCDVHKPEDGSVRLSEYTIEYPSSRGPIPVDGSTPEQFRQMFLNRIASDLVWKFTAHTHSESYRCD